jgi:hypothetical protein
MAAATKPALAAVDAAAMRRTVADAIEKLRALELSAEAWGLREIALTALRAVATTLFADAHATDHPGTLAHLVAEEIDRITELLAAAGAGGWRDEQAPATGRWGR